MTPTEIQRQCDEIVKLGEKATPGPNTSFICDAYCKEQDADLIAASRTFAPAAAVALKELNELDRISNDYVPHSIEDAALALHEMRQALKETIFRMTNAFHE